MIALAESVASIITDNKADKAAAMAKTFEQFGDYLKSNVPPRTEHGQSLLNLTKSEKELPMSDVDYFKLSKIESVVEVAKHIVAKGAAEISEFEFFKMLDGHARLAKRAGESDATAFSRIFTAPENATLRKAYGICKGYASLEPVSTEVGSSEFEFDGAEAIKQLNERAAKNGRSFEEEFKDPANFKLAQATYPYRNPNFRSAATK